VTPPLLALFDIDGTLTRRAGLAHRDALVAAVRAVVGIETRNDNISVHGKLDPDILLEMMSNAGVARSRAVAALPGIYRAAERYYLSMPADLRRKVCPGVRPLLRSLRRRRAVLGLVTGNLCRIGWKKLERAGLDQYFQFGVFAEMASTRTEMTRLALRHARVWGWSNGAGRAFLVGDTPFDVEAGRANGIQTIAVATGLSTIEELRACGATVVAPDLRHPAVIDLLRQ